MLDFKKYKYKYDLHVHSIPTSVCGDFSPEEVVNIYKNAGFCGFALTNHMYDGPQEYGPKEKFVKAYLDAYKRAKNAGEKLGISVFLGIEIRFPESTNDYLVYGIDEEDVSRAYDYIFTSYEKFYTEFKNERNLIIQAHPLRQPCFAQDVRLLDGIEVFNMHPGHNQRTALAAKLAYENPHLLITGGTDFHHEGHQGMCALLSDREIHNSFMLAEVIRSKDYILDIWGNKIVPNTF